MSNLLIVGFDILLAGLLVGWALRDIAAAIRAGKR